MFALYFVVYTKFYYTLLYSFYADWNFLKTSEPTNSQRKSVDFHFQVIN